jgi:UDP-4-amino-4,6-dideoxy-N-acetyl-beta-L-altrosamine transaminase
VNSDAPFLPYGRQEIDDDDVAAVAAALRSDWLTQGPRVEAFEAALAERVGARHAVACSSATAGLHLATLALALTDQDHAVVPTVTFLATANAVRYVGAEVVFADVDPDTALLTMATLEDALARSPGRVRALLPVHMNGQSCDMAAIGALARRRDLAVIEDAAHAIGAIDLSGNGSAPVGACRHSDMTVFSFHPVKTMTMGEGGVVTTNDDTLALRLRRMRAHGMTREPSEFVLSDLAFGPDGTPNPWYYEMTEFGFNYRATDLHCALGHSQLLKLDRFVERRELLARRYDAALSSLAPAIRPMARAPNGRPAWHLYAARFDFARLGRSRGQVMRELRARGIGSQVHYLPVHLQPYYRQRYGVLDLPGARTYYESCLSLPLFPSMSEDDVDRVVAALAGLAASSR